MWNGWCEIDKHFIVFVVDFYQLLLHHTQFFQRQWMLWIVDEAYQICFMDGHKDIDNQFTFRISSAFTPNWLPNTSRSSNGSNTSSSKSAALRFRSSHFLYTFGFKFSISILHKTQIETLLDWRVICFAIANARYVNSERDGMIEVMHTFIVHLLFSLTVVCHIAANVMCLTGETLFEWTKNSLLFARNWIKSQIMFNCNHPERREWIHFLGFWRLKAILMKKKIEIFLISMATKSNFQSPNSP